MKNVDFVLHVASPFLLKVPKNHDEILKPAIEGTKNILNASLKNNIKKVVITSSMAAIRTGENKN